MVQREIKIFQVKNVSKSYSKNKHDFFLCRQKQKLNLIKNYYSGEGKKKKINSDYALIVERLSSNARDGWKNYANYKISSSSYRHRRNFFFCAKRFFPDIISSYLKFFMCASKASRDVWKIIILKRYVDEKHERER